VVPNGRGAVGRSGGEGVGSEKKGKTKSQTLEKKGGIGGVTGESKGKFGGVDTKRTRGGGSKKKKNPEQKKKTSKNPAWEEVGD